jgi:DNA-binding beta-propeller fold protein YncE
MKLKNIFVIIIFCFSIYAFSQPVAKDVSQISSEEEFRRGVLAYYRGAFNEAVLQFEKALSFAPSDNRVLEWLGKAYYRSGLESSALKQWEYASANGYGGLLLKNRIEIVKERRIANASFDKKERYVEAGSFIGNDNGTLRFSQPISLLPNIDGTTWVVAYGSNELLKKDVNGTIISRIRGPLNGFDRPLDIVEDENKNLIISEFASDRISMLNKDGKYIKSFGKKGSKNGQLLGPQYIAIEKKSGRIYVTDFGNARVVVFDKEGKALFTFGQSNQYFTGLKAPTGIAALNSLIYVADAVLGTVYVFDTAGNYMDSLVRERTLQKPEAMKIWNNYLILADGNRVLSVDTSSGVVSEIANIGNAPANITCAMGDANGNLLVTDIVSNEVYVLSKMSELVGGFFVNVERVIAENFPNVIVDFRVENHKRQPIVGLKAQNFLVTEKNVPVAEKKLSGVAYANDSCDITIIVDRLSETKQYEKEIEIAISEISKSMNGKGRFSVISAGTIPVLEGKGNPKSFENFSASVMQNSYGQTSAVDLALRLAGNDLIVGEAKRAIVYLSSGEISSNAFDKYTYADTAAWLNNNGIVFMTVNLSQKTRPGAIAYLTRQTLGGEYYVYRPEGLLSLVDDVCNLPNGLYRITYKSNLPTDFGRAFLPVELEVYLHNRSGRDESGYFAPLQ